MANIKRCTNWLQVISIAFMLVIFGEICCRWLFFSGAANFLYPLYAKVSYSFNGNWLQELSEMSFIQRLGGFAIDIFGLVILCFGIIAFNKLLKLLKSQIFFTSDTIKLLSTLSKLALTWTVYNPTRGTLLSIITTLHKEVGNRMISFQFGLKDMINIFIFVCMILVTVLLQEGFKLKKEQDLTI